MRCSRTVVVALAPLFLLALAPAQDTRWSIPPHGVVRYAQEGMFTGVRTDGSEWGLLDSASTMFHPLLFADELADDATHLRDEPWSLPAIPLWLAFDLRTFDRPGPMHNVWARIAQFGEVTFEGTAEPPDADGWQRITGRLIRQPVRELAGWGPSELVFESHYLSGTLDLRLELRRRFRSDGAGQDRYGRRGSVASIEFTFDGSLGIGVPRLDYRLSGKRTLQLTGTQGQRVAPGGAGPGFDEEVARATQSVVEHLLALLGDFQGAVADGESRGAVHGPSLHAAMLYGLARAGRRVGDPGIDEALARLLRRDHTQAHGVAFTILAIAGLHAPADERAACLRGQPARIDLPLPMRNAMQAAVRDLLRIRLRTRSGTGFWSFAADARSCSLFHSCVAIQALDVATRCGIRVPQSAFEGLARHLVTTAIEVPGIAAARLVLEPGLVREAPARRAGNRKADRTGDRPVTGGAACTWDEGEIGAFAGSGDRVAFAMAALLACNRHVKDAELRDQATQCVERGWAWLGHYFTPRHSPSEMSVMRHHCHEWTFALAWLLDETGVRSLNGRDLYHEHAVVRLVDTDRGNVDTTVADGPATLAFWRPVIDFAAPVTPGR